MSSEYNSNYGSSDSVGDLQYDDSAFWYYSLAVLSVFLIVTLIYILREYLQSVSLKNTQVQIPSIPHFQSKLNTILSKRKMGGSLFKKTVFLGLLVYFWSMCLSRSLQAKDFKSFDPFALLEVDSSATEKEIKKSYRKLARKYHPDLNPGDREAYNMFLQVTKAYQCLTDPETKETCAKFGNPDGNASFEVGVAIPSFFLKQENTKLVLSLFFIVLFLGTLIYLVSLNSNDDLNKYGVSQKTMRNCFNFFKNENMIFKNVVEMMAISEELRPLITAKKEQLKDMIRIQDNSLKSSLSKKEFHIFKKPIFIINYHMNNDEAIPPSIKGDLLFIQEKAIGLFVSLFEMGFEMVQFSKQYTKMWEKPLSPRVLQTLCSFSQHFFQGMSINESPLLQLPFVDRSNVKRLDNKLKLKSFKDLLNESSEPREKLMDLVCSTKEDKKQLINALDCFSQFEIKVESYVDLGEGEKDQVIRQGDIFTMEIEITRKNKHVGYIYSQKLDFLKLERISSLVYFKKNKHILHFETKFTKEKTHKVEIKGEVPLVGDFELVIVVESDSYVGVGVQEEYILKVEKPQKVEGYDLHPDDQEALTKPSFFMSLLSNALEDGDNSDEEFEEEEEEEQEEDKEKNTEEIEDADEDTIKETKE
jgi:translocation protein SEC63